MTSRYHSMLWSVCLLLAASLCYGIATLPLRDYRETTYAEIAREMLVTHDYLVPHLNGTPHLDKPPLVPWLVALALQTGGISQGAARLPSVVAIWWTALMVGWMAYRLGGPEAGLLAAVLLLGAPGMQYYGRMLMTDTVSMAVNLTALAAFLEGYMRASRRAYYLGFAACGLGVLTRGLPGIVYPLGALIAFVVLFDRQAWRHVPWGTGLLLFGALTAPWFVLMELRYPGFLALFFVQHHVDRFNPVALHPFVALPRWQILLGFAGFVGPLTLLLPWAVRRGRQGQLAQPMLWIFAGIVLASVLLSTGRNHPYTLPALPPLVVLVATWLGPKLRETTTAGWRPAALLVALFGCTVLGTLPWIAPILGMISPVLATPTTRLTLQVCLTLVALPILAGGLLLWHRHGVAAGVALAVMMLPGAYMLTHVQQQLAPKESRASLARVVAREVPDDWPVVLVNPQDLLFEGVGGWGFYAQRPVLMVALQPPQGPFQGVTRPEWIIDVGEFCALWNAGRPFVLAAPPDVIAQLPVGPLPAPRTHDGRFSLWFLPAPAPGESHAGGQAFSALTQCN